MNITLKTEYALRALYEIINTDDNKPVKRKTISRRQNISEHFLEQIFLLLQKRNIIKSIRGPKGGFVLAKPTNEISLWDIYEAVEEKTITPYFCETPEMKNKCDFYHQCKIKEIWLKINYHIKKSMSSIKLNELILTKEETDESS